MKHEVNGITLSASWMELIITRQSNVNHNNIDAGQTDDVKGENEEHQNDIERREQGINHQSDEKVKKMKLMRRLVKTVNR